MAKSEAVFSSAGLVHHLVKVFLSSLPKLVICFVVVVVGCNGQVLVSKVVGGAVCGVYHDSCLAAVVV